MGNKPNISPAEPLNTNQTTYPSDNSAGSTGDVYETAQNQFKDGDYANAIESFNRAAVTSSLAKITLGQIYRDGLGVPVDTEAAISLFTKASEEDKTGQAFTQLGLVYFKGLGVEPDATKATGYLKQAMEQGNLEAQSHLGFMYVDGKLIPRDVEQGMKLLMEAANNSGDANNYLGFIFMIGTGVARNYPLAFSHFTKAVDMGNLNSHIYLALMHLNGWGTSRTAWDAAKLLSRAAEKGNPRAQCYLGLLYRDGVGLTQSDKIAKKWLKKAAEQSDTLGMYSYGKFLLDKEADADWLSVIDWFSKASRQGNLDGEIMESLYVDGLMRVFDGNVQ